MMMTVRSLMVALAIFGTMSDSAVAQTFSHDDWTEVLERFVDDSGRVAYAALAEDRTALDRYIEAIGSTGPTTHPELFPDRGARLAYYLNGYNALVFGGVLSRGPERVSVWKGGLISGYKFFVGMKVTIDGKKTSLKKLEDKIIRDGFQDPRIHAALNCASIGCPRLPRKAFDPEDLDAELDAAMREFARDPKHVRLDDSTGVVQLSKIFDWFSGDFLAFDASQGADSPTLVGYLNRYRDARQQIPADAKVRFLEYDKGINAQ